MLQKKSRPKGRRQLIGRKLIKELFMNRVFAAKYNLPELKKHKDFLIAENVIFNNCAKQPNFQKSLLSGRLSFNAKINTGFKRLLANVPSMVC
ncbi:MAG: hypothetical protein CMF70_02545 [Magnetovibrio sp.]|nr:hypothetical protein [Magnetovibrio sp.]